MNSFGFSDAMKAIDDAKNTLLVADMLVCHLASLMVGRLNIVRPDTLVRLKKELQSFNAHTKKWEK